MKKKKETHTLERILGLSSFQTLFSRVRFPAVPAIGSPTPCYILVPAVGGITPIIPHVLCIPSAVSPDSWVLGHIRGFTRDVKSTDWTSDGFGGVVGEKGGEERGLNQCAAAVVIVADSAFTISTTVL